MNSLQGGWGIQDRHDRVISWLSGIVVCLLVIYALIFISRQVLPGEQPLPTVSPTPVVSATPSPTSGLPDLPTLVPTATAPVTRIPTRVASLPDPTPRPTLPTRLPPVVTRLPPPPATTVVRLDPTPSPTFPTRVPPRPSPQPSLRPVTTRPTQIPRLPTQPPRLPTPTALPTTAPVRTPAGDGPFMLRVGKAFSSGSQALAFARRFDVLQSQLAPESSRPGSRLFLEDGPFATRREAMQEMERLRRRVGDPSLSLVIRGAKSATPAPPYRPPVSERPTPTTRPPATPAPIPTSVAVVTPPLRPVVVGELPSAVNDPALSVSEAEEILRSRYGWQPPTFRGYTLQVSSFQRLANAVNFRNHLGAKGYEAYLDLAEVRGGAYFRVLAGVYGDIGEAREQAAEFQARHGETYKVFVRKR